MNQIIPKFNGKAMELAWGSYEPDSAGYISYGFHVRHNNILVSVEKFWDKENIYFWHVGFGGYESTARGSAASLQEAADKAYHFLDEMRNDIHNMIR